jgi:hypothetical protein
MDDNPYESPHEAKHSHDGNGQLPIGSIFGVVMAILFAALLAYTLLMPGCLYYFSEQGP